MPTTFVRVTFFVFTCLCIESSYSESRFFQGVFEEDRVREVSSTKVNPPKNIPQSKDLMAFSPSGNSQTLEFFLDKKSIAVEEDVVRYVVVVRSREGAVQTLFSGVDCYNYSKITYASLQDGVWQSYNPEWKPIPNVGYNNYQAYLARKAFCVGLSANSNLSDILFRLTDDNLR